MAGHTLQAVLCFYLCAERESFCVVWTTSPERHLCFLFSRFVHATRNLVLLKTMELFDCYARDLTFLSVNVLNSELRVPLIIGAGLCDP